MSERVIVRKGEAIDGATGHYEILIEKESLEERRIGGVFARVIDNYYVLCSYGKDSSNDGVFETVFGIEKATCTYSTVSKRLEAHAREIGKNKTERAIIDAFIRHAESLPWEL